MNKRERLIVTIILVVWMLALALAIHLEDTRAPICLKGIGTPIPCETFYASRDR